MSFERTMWLTGGLGLWLVLASGCFNPTYSNPRCGPAGECPANFTCIDGTCRGPSGSDGGHDACVSLQCNVVDCAAQDAMPTTISGRIHAPNGTLKLYGVHVYVPNEAMPDVADGVVCDRCDGTLPGNPVVQTTTDVNGDFTLTNVPSGPDVPLVIASGKWRRQVTISNVTACTDNPIGYEETRLPRTSAEGHIPRIALSTGAADALECLIRKVGIADSEIGTAGGMQRVHLYADVASGAGQGATQFASGFPGGTGAFADSATVWGDPAAMSKYDMIVLSCEGAQYPASKTQPHMDNMKAYADAGGRVLMTHWHNIWIEGSTQSGGTQAPAVWTSVATWNNASTTFSAPPDVIDEINNPKGTALASWMLAVGGSPSRGVVPISANSGKQTCAGVNEGRADRWVYWDTGTTVYPQNFLFTTPNEAPIVERCGKVMFSDMHVSSDSTSDGAFPTGCSPSALTPQEKVLAFMFFDLASCI